MTTPSGDLWTLEQAEDEIAEIRGQVDLMSEIITTSDVQTATLEATGAVTAGIITSAGGTQAVPTLITTDTWHTLGTLAGYTVNIGRYRLTIENEVEIDVDVQAGGANAATVAFGTVLPAAYRPTIDRRLPISTSRVQTAGETIPRLFVQQSTGQVQIVQTLNNAAQMGTVVRIPLD